MDSSLAVTLSTIGSFPFCWYLWVIFSKVSILLKHFGYSSSFLSEPSTSQFSNKNIDMYFLVACLVMVDPSKKLLHSLWSNKKVWHDVTAALKLSWIPRWELERWLSWYTCSRSYQISSPNQWFCTVKKSASQNLSYLQGSVLKFLSHLKNGESWVNVQGQGRASLDARHHTCLLRPGIQRHKRAKLFMAPHHRDMRPALYYTGAAWTVKYGFMRGSIRYGGDEYWISLLPPSTFVNKLSLNAWRMSQLCAAINFAKMVQCA